MIIRVKLTHLSAQIGDDDKLLENVLGKNVGVAGVFDVVGVDVNVLRAQMQVGRADRSHSPLGTRSKRLALKRARGRSEVVLRQIAICPL